MTWLIRVVEAVFFTGVLGCLVTIGLSWFSIFKEELTSNK
jgi:hypothetical protein